MARWWIQLQSLCLDKIQMCICILFVSDELFIHTWHLDHAGSLKKSEEMTQILFVVNPFSKYCRLLPVTRRTSDYVIKVLVFIIAHRDTAFGAV